MAILTREQILAMDDLPEETVSVLSWGGDIVVRGLTRGEAHAAREACKDKDGNVSMLDYDMQTLLRGVIKPKFTEKDFGALKKKSAGSIEIVTSRIMQLSSVGITGNVTQEAVKEAESSFRDGEE